MPSCRINMATHICFPFPVSFQSRSLFFSTTNTSLPLTISIVLAASLGVSDFQTHRSRHKPSSPPPHGFVNIHVFTASIEVLNL